MLMLLCTNVVHQDPLCRFYLRDIYTTVTRDDRHSNASNIFHSNHPSLTIQARLYSVR